MSYSLETPTPPDEHHIPQYRQVSDFVTDVVCWEVAGDELRLWETQDKVYVLSRGENRPVSGEQEDDGEID